ALGILALLLFASGSTSAQAPNDSQKPGVTPSPPKVATALMQTRIWAAFDAGQALAEAKIIADFGPRPSGSDANKQVRKHITDRLAVLGWQTTEQRLVEHALHQGAGVNQKNPDRCTLRYTSCSGFSRRRRQ